MKGVTIKSCFTLCHITGALPTPGCTGQSQRQHLHLGQSGEGCQVEHERVAVVKVTDRYVMGLHGLCFVSLLLLAQGFQVVQGECDLLIFNLLPLSWGLIRTWKFSARGMLGCWDVFILLQLLKQPILEPIFMATQKHICVQTIWVWSPLLCKPKLGYDYKLLLISWIIRTLNGCKKTNKQESTS